MVATEELAVLRAMVEGDFTRQKELSNALYATGGLDSYGEAIAAAFYVAVRMQFPQRYCAEDVIRLVSDARIMFDQTGDVVDPHAAELIVRATLGERELAEGMSDTTVVQTQIILCSYLAAERKLGEPDAFMREVQKLLEQWNE